MEDTITKLPRLDYTCILSGQISGESTLAGWGIESTYHCLNNTITA